MGKRTVEEKGGGLAAFFVRHPTDAGEQKNDEPFVHFGDFVGLVFEDVEVAFVAGPVAGNRDQVVGAAVPGVDDKVVPSGRCLYGRGIGFECVRRVEFELQGHGGIGGRRAVDVEECGGAREVFAQLR